jgi:hypothetical protein
MGAHEVRVSNVGGLLQSTQTLPQFGGEPFGPGSQLPFHTHESPPEAHCPFVDPSGKTQGG